jgi:hypothetical protein
MVKPKQKTTSGEKILKSWKNTKKCDRCQQFGIELQLGKCNVFLHKKCLKNIQKAIIRKGFKCHSFHCRDCFDYVYFKLEETERFYVEKITGQSENMIRLRTDDK